MKSPLYKTVLLVLIVFLAAPAFAVKLSGDEREITVGVNASPYTSSFDTAGNLIVWVDYRDPDSSRVYAAFSDDPAYNEHLVDANAPNAWNIRTDGRKIIYNFYDTTTNLYGLSVADVNDIGNPIVRDVNTSGGYIQSLDIDNGIGAYYDNGNNMTSSPAGIFVFDTNEPNECCLVREMPQEAPIYSNIAIDDKLISYCEYFYDSETYLWRYGLVTIDVTDFANPVISRTPLPFNAESWAQSYIYQLDADGDWLIAYGAYLGTTGVFAIHNYRGDAAGWEYKMLSEISGETYAPVRIDGTYAVWIENSQLQPASIQPVFEAYNPQKLRGIYLMGAALFDTGRTSVSAMKNFSDPNWMPEGAAVAGDKASWGASYYHYDPDTQEEEYYNDLFTDTIELECGDKGYLFGDFNRDCVVNFIDFATFAENWLKCTLPEDSACTFGD